MPIFKLNSLAADAKEKRIIQEPDELQFYKGIIVCEFSDVSQHIDSLQAEQIQAIFFKLTEEQRGVFTQAKDTLQASVSNKTTQKERRINLNAERRADQADPQFFTFTPKGEGGEFSIVDGPESVREAFRLMGHFLDVAGIYSQQHFAKQSEPRDWSFYSPEFRMHRDRYSGRRPQEDIHAHVTVDAPGLNFRKHDILMLPKQRVPQGYCVLFNALWLHGVPRSTKLTGRTAFGGYKKHGYDL